MHAARLSLHRVAEHSLLLRWLHRRHLVQVGLATSLSVLLLDVLGQLVLPVVFYIAVL
jgi:hypothetical protein